MNLLLSSWQCMNSPKMLNYHFKMTCWRTKYFSIYNDMNEWHCLIWSHTNMKEEYTTHAHAVHRVGYSIWPLQSGYHSWFFQENYPTELIWPKLCNVYCFFTSALLLLPLRAPWARHQSLCCCCCCCSVAAGWWQHQHQQQRFVVDDGVCNLTRAREGAVRWNVLCVLYVLSNFFTVWTQV